MSTIVLTSAFHGGWRSKHVPHGLGADLARGRHVEGNLEELVALVDDGAGLIVHSHQPNLQHVTLLVRLACFPLAGIQQLKDARYVLRVCSYHVALRYGPHVKHLAEILNKTCILKSNYVEVGRCLPKIQDDDRVGVLLVALGVVKYNLAAGHNNVLLPPAVSFDVLLGRYGQPALEHRVCVVVVTVVVGRTQRRRLAVECRQLHLQLLDLRVLAVQFHLQTLLGQALFTQLRLTTNYLKVTR